MAEVYQQLSKWKIQLPVNSSGQLSGSMASYVATQDRKPWYDIDGTKLHFQLPDNGAKSGNSSHPRCELVQISSWEGSHSLEVDMKMTHGTGRTVVMQIWSHSQSNPLFGACYDHDKKRIDFTIWRKDRTRIFKTFPDVITVGTRFKLKAKIADGKLAVTLNGVTKTTTIPSGMGPRYSFKFGLYVDEAKSTVYRATV